MPASERERKYQAAYRATHREEAKAAARRWREANRDRYLEVARAAVYKNRYGITIEEYDAMVAAQDGRCAVCGDPPARTRLHVDHDHATGAVRALLCHGCNSALGHGKDDPARLRALADYLEKLHRGGK